VLFVSALTGAGLDALLAEMWARMGGAADEPEDESGADPEHGPKEVDA
jgi:hypothetical protein